jgi:molecular chaperone DnaK
MLVVDVGSWALTAAMIVGEQVHPVPEPLTGMLRWPAGASLDGRELLVGAAAERHRQVAPRQYLDGIRRTIDSSAPVWFGQQQLTGTEALAAALDAIATEARRLNSASVDRLVLTVPAAYRMHDQRREALVSAAAIAGFPDVELVADSVAAALDPLTRIVPAEGAHLLVCDLGANWTATLVLAQHGRLVQIGQETSGGGRDLDTLLAADLRAALPEWTEPALNAGGDTAARAAFLAFDVVRQLKHRLSDADEAAERPEPGAPAYQLSRAALERLAEPSLRWLVASARAVVARAGLHPSAVSAVILTGGSANLPATGQILHSGLGRPVTRPPEPEFGVLRGAARWALNLPDRAVPADPPRWRIEPLSWDIPGGRARLVRWLVKEGEPFGAQAVLAQVRTAEDRVFDLTAGRTAGVLLEQRVHVGGVVATGALAATARTATDADRFQLTKRHHLQVAGRWLLTPDRQRLVEWPATAEYVKVRSVANGGLVNELRPVQDGARQGRVMLAPGQHLALVTWDVEGNFAVWDVASGQLTAKFSGGHRPHLVLVNEARWRLVTTADSATSTGRYRRDVATVWDLATGARIDKFVGDDLHRRFSGYAEHSAADAFAIETNSPDGRLRAAAHEHTVSVRDVEHDHEVFRADHPGGRAHTAFTHDGRHLLTRWETDEAAWIDVFEVLGGPA